KQLPDRCYKLQPWSRWYAPSLLCVLLPVHSHPHFLAGCPGALSGWLSFPQAMCLLSRLHPSQGQTSPFRAHDHLVKGHLRIVPMLHQSAFEFVPSLHLSRFGVVLSTFSNELGGRVVPSTLSAPYVQVARKNNLQLLSTLFF